MRFSMIDVTCDGSGRIVEAARPSRSSHGTVDLRPKSWRPMAPFGRPAGPKAPVLHRCGVMAAGSLDHGDRRVLDRRHRKAARQLRQEIDAHGDPPDAACDASPLQGASWSCPRQPDWRRKSLSRRHLFPSIATPAGRAGCEIFRERPERRGERVGFFFDAANLFDRNDLYAIERGRAAADLASSSARL